MAKPKNRPRSANYQPIVGSYKMIPDSTLLSSEFQSLAPSELKIYICFLTYWIRNGKHGETVKMSIEFISEHTGLTRQTIRTNLKSLRDKEFIEYVSVKNVLTTYTLVSRHLY